MKKGTRAAESSKFIHVFKIYKKNTTVNGPVTIVRKAGDSFNEKEKRGMYRSLGYTITEI